MSRNLHHHRRTCTLHNSTSPYKLHSLCNTVEPDTVQRKKSKPRYSITFKICLYVVYKINQASIVSCLEDSHLVPCRKGSK